ncbi:hypothetical protein ACFQU2_17710 [Siccirubricoccus deserti]
MRWAGQPIGGVVAGKGGLPARRQRLPIRAARHGTSPPASGG